MSVTKQVVLINVPKPDQAPVGVSTERLEALAAERGWVYKEMVRELEERNVRLAKLSHEQCKLNDQICKLEEAGASQEAIDAKIAEHKEGYEHWEKEADLRGQLVLRLKTIWKTASKQ
jgi:hypothetical protein